MRIIATIVFVILIGFGLWRLLHGSSPKQVESKPAQRDTYQALRNLALQSSRAKLGLPPTSTPTQPWGVIMDWGLNDGIATTVAFSDGNASVYLSTGGGFLGGAPHESILKAAKNMVAIAAECQPQTHTTAVYPLPQQSKVYFYLLTDAGVFTASAGQEDLSNHRHPLWQLGEAGQAIITQYRLIQENLVK
jgi:hypothetical protein